MYQNIIFTIVLRSRKKTEKKSAFEIVHMMCMYSYGLMHHRALDK